MMLLATAGVAFAADGNRLVYLDESDPYYVSRNFPKLTTPQWIGEEGVEAVVVLAVDENSSGPKVLLEKQYRHAAGRFLLELPAGRIDEGENELKAAKRELLEETGYSAQRWKRVLRFWASPGFVAEAMSIYLARGLRVGTAQPEDDEVITLQFIALKKAVAMVMKGTIQDAKTIAGVLWLDRQSGSGSRQ